MADTAPTQTSAPRPPTGALERAVSLRESGELEAAEAAYAAILAKAPGALAAQMGLGICARRRGDREAAIARFRAAAEAHPEAIPPRIELAAEFRERDRLDEAEAIYAEALAAAPRNVPLLLAAGTLARRRGDRETALARFNEAVSSNARASNYLPSLELAMELRETGRLDEAETVYRTILKEAPRLVPALVGIGLCLRRRGDRRLALARFKAAVEATQNPLLVVPRLEMAAELRELGRLDEAEEAYRAILEAVPGQLQALIGLGGTARRRGDREAAMAHFRDAIAAEPDNIAALLEVANELRDSGDYPEAIAIAEDARARFPDDVRPVMSLANTRRRAGERDAALETFRQAAALDRDRPDVMIELAIEERRLGQPEIAEQRLSALVAAHPNHARALVELSEMARARLDLEASLALLQRAMAADPRQSQPVLLAAQALAELDRPDEAFALLNAFQKGKGNRPEVKAKLAALLRETGEWREARALTRRALAAAPWHFALWQQRFQIERLFATDAEIEQLLAEAPAANTVDRAALTRLRGNLADDAWQIGAAIGLYQEALTLHPDDIEAVHDLARASLMINDVETARASLRRLTDLRVWTHIVASRSTNISQSHLGQLIDEYLLDDAALAELVKLRALPAPARIERLHPILAVRPDYTPAAIALMLALRQSGAFDRVFAQAATGKTASGNAASAEAPLIPRAIMQYWDATEPPPELLEISASWRMHNPGFTHVLFDDPRATIFLASHFTPDVVLAYRRAVQPAQKADLFRLAYLVAMGGFYADMDDRCMRPIDEFVPAGASLALVQENYGTIGNNFIGAAPHSPVLIRALEWGVAALNRGDSDLLWLSTGPGLLTRALAAALISPPLFWRAWMPRVAVLAARDVNRVIARHCRASYKRTDRHWQHSSFGRRQMPAASDAPSEAGTGDAPPAAEEA